MIALRAYLRQRLMLISYANSHAQHMQKAIERFLFQSPRRWGGVGLALNMEPAAKGGEIEFQSPRRWGGVGLSSTSTHPSNGTAGFQSPRRWGGVGLPCTTPPRNIGTRFGFNPLGGGAGSGSRCSLSGAGG